MKLLLSACPSIQVSVKTKGSTQGSTNDNSKFIVSILYQFTYSFIYCKLLIDEVVGTIPALQDLVRVAKGQNLDASCVHKLIELAVYP
ncbi:MAG: hypothetical protein F6K09_27000 [Merismopedia sp. SIO2A8]|nr:hypothetical protein [Symploca sp. SIO2B6]NET52208.1 hypothetical protein [Merismopedia sp. SIO2A8]